MAITQIMWTPKASNIAKKAKWRIICDIDCQLDFMGKERRTDLHGKTNAELADILMDLYREEWENNGD